MEASPGLWPSFETVACKRMRPPQDEDGVYGGAYALIHHHAPDALALMHQIERLVDVGERHGVGDHRVDLDLPIHVPVDDLGHVGAPARAAEGGALPHPPGHELERPRRDLL